MNNKRTLVNLYKDIVLIVTSVRIVYQQQHKSCNSNAYPSDGSFYAWLAIHYYNLK